jgi:wyosine [tRNA(Phe)-imidazoG37] synthetase (radical SAM superfamily)
MAPYRYLFGPVPSRRLGLSLGIDLCPMKTCCMDCVFCQLGHTQSCTIERREYVPTALVLAELREWKAAGGTADCLTLSGSGEPTLHTGFGEVLRFIRSETPFKSALLSNGALMTIPEVRLDAALADIVKVSLSAWDAESFRRVNRSHPALRFADLVRSYESLRTAFRGELWLEVFVIRGVNDSRRDMAAIASLASQFAPDRVHLNTAVRPAADADVNALTAGELAALADLFDPPAEVIAEFKADKEASKAAVDDEALAALVSKHPATVRQIAAALGVSAEQVASGLERLRAAGRVLSQERSDGIYHYTR